MKTLLAPPLAVAFCCLSLVARAEPPTPLDPIVVTATGTEVPASEVLAPLTIINRSEIERAQAGDLAELLRFQTGIEIGRNGGPGQVTSVFVRGGESNHTLVLIDGVRVNPATAGGAALQNIAPEMIERIEIIKGPRASLYGSDAIAAVINVITRRAADTLSGDAYLRGGRYGTREGGAGLRAADADGSVSLDASHLESDGFPSFAGSSTDRGYRRSTVNLGLARQFGAVELAARGWLTRGNTEYSGFFGEALDQDFRNGSGALSAGVQASERWHSALRVSQMVDDIEQNQSEDYTRTRRSEVDWDNVVALGAHRLSGGLAFAREDVDALGFGSRVSDTRDIFSLRAQDELQLGRHRAVVGLSYVDHEAFGGQLNGNLEYGFDLREDLRLIAAAGTGFRAPDATDRFGFGGNPELDPERARNYELGAQWRYSAAQSLDLRLFRSEVRDLISVICTANCNDADFFNDVFMATNIDRYRNQGIEASYRLELEHWSARLGGLLQDPIDEADGSQLLRRAKRTVSASLLRRIGAHSLGIDALGSSERPDFGTTLPGYALLNLTGTLALPAGFSLQGRIENLLDKDYQTAAGFNQSRRAGYLTLRYRFD